jgi:dTDP-4-amino-4,6-dideoxygalactose transaminase
VVRCEDRGGFQQHLEANGIGTDIQYPIPDHLQPAYADPEVNGLTETERLAKEVVTIPCFAEMDEDEISGVIRAVNNW